MISPSTSNLMELVDGPLSVEIISKMEIVKGLQMQMYILSKDYNLEAEHPIIQDVARSYMQALEELIVTMETNDTYLD